MSKEKFKHYCKCIGLAIFFIIDDINYILTKYIMPTLVIIVMILYHYLFTK